MRLTVVLVLALLAFLAIGCNEDGASGSAGTGPVPTPAGAPNRQDCEVISATDYFLNDEERAWFRDNCNRLDCNAIRGTPYVSTIERNWYLRNCI
jgi:hypothetical protein